jgi:uncharacterized protein (DUF1501 family)
MSEGPVSQLSRRSALQLIAGGLTVASVSEPFADTFFRVRSVPAPPGYALIVYLAGGNDQLSTLVPFADRQYQKSRKHLALEGTSVVDIGGGWGFNSRLRNLMQLWDSGLVAVHQGVGYSDSSLSHFDAAAAWMTGRPSGDRSTGWLGRYLDGLTPTLPVAGVAIGNTIPLLLRGRTTQALALPPDLGDAIGATVVASADESYGRFVDAVRRFADGEYPSSLARRIASNGVRAIETSGRLSDEYNGLLGGGTTRQMGAAARVLSSELGVRVAYVQQNGYDTHANQPATHQALLGDLDDGIGAFFANLSPEVRPAATVVIFSEFGRRPTANASNGTDHGTASDVWVIGANVKGGRFGEPPAFDRLDQNGNFVVTASFGQVMADALAPVLGSSVRTTLRAAALLKGRTSRSTSVK